MTETYLFSFRSKFPQLLTIYQQKSATGISLKSLTIEIMSYSVSMLYNFTNGYRLMNYLEYVVLIAQDYMLVAIVLYYRKSITQKAIGITVIYFIVMTLFGASILPKSLLTLCIPGTLPASVLSKSMQLVEIIRSKDSSAISSITWFISAFSNASECHHNTFQFIAIAQNLSYDIFLLHSQQLAFIRLFWTPLMKCCWPILLFRLHSHLQFLLLCFITRNRWQRHQRKTKKLTGYERTIENLRTNSFFNPFPYPCYAHQKVFYVAYTLINYFESSNKKTLFKSNMICNLSALVA